MSSQLSLFIYGDYNANCRHVVSVRWKDLLFGVLLVITAMGGS